MDTKNQVNIIIITISNLFREFFPFSSGKSRSCGNIRHGQTIETKNLIFYGIGNSNRKFELSWNDPC